MYRASTHLYYIRISSVIQMLLHSLLREPHFETLADSRRTLILSPSFLTLMKTIRWGFIGCGEVTERKSGPAFNAIEGSEVVAVMSRRAEKAKSYA